MGALDWSASPDENALADPLVPAGDRIAARQFPEAIRGVMAGVAGVASDALGALPTTGTLNAYIVRSATAPAVFREGLSFRVKADRANTGPATLNRDGLGPRPWREKDGTELVAGRVKQGMVYLVVADFASGVWRSDFGPASAADVPGLPDALAAKAGRARRAVADAAYPAVATDVYIGMSSLTAGRTITLPSAASYPPGQTLYVADESGQCSAQVPITVAAAGADTIAGQPSITLASPYQKLAFHSNGSNLWTY